MKKQLDKKTQRALKGNDGFGSFLYDVTGVRCTKLVRVVHLYLRQNVMVLHFFYDMLDIITDFHLEINDDIKSTPPVTCSLTTSRTSFLFFGFSFPCYQQITFGGNRGVLNRLRNRFAAEYMRTNYYGIVEQFGSFSFLLTMAYGPSGLAHNFLCQFQSVRRVQAKEQQDRLRRHLVVIDEIDELSEKR